MDLKDFIKNAISAITNGILEAQQELSEKNVIINPEFQKDGRIGGSILRSDGERYVQELDFEIFVNFEEKTATGGGGKLSVLNIVSFGLDGKNEVSAINTNRLKFKIPIAFPVSKTPLVYKAKQAKGLENL